MESITTARTRVLLWLLLILVLLLLWLNQSTQMLLLIVYFLRCRKVLKTVLYKTVISIAVVLVL
ncbi:hypothetical protein ES20_02770 [Rothia aeria]|nr:hypothetical protein ES20_02770 [Rothia aeria]KGJ33841.1 hypothetical protein ES18_06995 [Rothia aeria]